MSAPGTAPKVLVALAEAALDITGAAEGWLLCLRSQCLEVVAAAGPSSGRLIGTELPTNVGAAGFVAASGRPLALSAGADDPRLSEGVPALLGRRPTCLLAVPCLDDGVLTGVLELVDKGSGAFSFDDVEIATLFGSVAGVALGAEGITVPDDVPSADELAAGLQQMAAADPARFAAVAGVIALLLA